jgi:hypothetical protein
MTAKRFTVDKDGRTILDNIDDSYCECVDGYEAKQYCGKLNELHEENTILKALLNKLSDKDGRIVLINGYGYNVRKILEDLE